MLEAHTVITTPEKLPAQTQTALVLELAFDDRQKSRHKATTQCGQPIGWFIERGHVLKQGEFLVCTTGQVIAITAAPESVSTVRAHTALDLTRAAYHLGNRHVPLQITPEYLRFQHDHVLDEMIKGLGLQVTCELAPFQPEPGAYAKGHGHSHGDDSHNGHTHSGHSHG